MALVKCKECEHEISDKASTCPSCGVPTGVKPKPPKQKTSLFTWIVAIFFLVAIFKGITASNSGQGAANKAADKKAGFHCLSQWDGSHASVVRSVKKSMKDPDSFDHRETRITPVDASGNHTLIMKYAGRNSFGGMAVEAVTATIKNSDCSVTALNKV